MALHYIMVGGCHSSFELVTSFSTQGRTKHRADCISIDEQVSPTAEALCEAVLEEVLVCKMTLARFVLAQLQASLLPSFHHQPNFPTLSTFISRLTLNCHLARVVSRTGGKGQL